VSEDTEPTALCSCSNGRESCCSTYEEASYVNRCRHRVDYIPAPRGDGGCQLIPILVEAT